MTRVTGAEMASMGGAAAEMGPSVAGQREFVRIIEKMSGTVVLETAAERIARRLWLDYWNDLRARAGPVDSRQIARLRGVLEVINEDLEGEGRLVPVTGGFRIELRRGDPPARRNFTCAHEIGHTYFFDLECREPRRLIGTGPLVWRLEEAFCDHFAESLLMVAETVRSYVLKFPLGSDFRWFESTARYFRTTVKSIVRRICYLQTLADSNLVVVLVEKRGEELTGRDKRLRITAWSGPRTMHFFSPGAPIEAAKLQRVRDFWDLGHRQTGPTVREVIGISVPGGRSKWVDCMGRYRSYGQADRKYLIGLFRIRDVTSSPVDQLRS